MHDVSDALRRLRTTDYEHHLGGKGIGAPRQPVRCSFTGNVLDAGDEVYLLVRVADTDEGRTVGITDVCSRAVGADLALGPSPRELRRNGVTLRARLEPHPTIPDQTALADVRLARETVHAAARLEAATADHPTNQNT